MYVFLCQWTMQYIFTLLKQVQKSSIRSVFLRFGATMGGQTQLKFSCHWFWTLYGAPFLPKIPPRLIFIIIIHIIFILIKSFSDPSCLLDGGTIIQQDRSTQKNFCIDFLWHCLCNGRSEPNHVRKGLPHHKAATGFILAGGVEVFLPKYAMHWACTLAVYCFSALHFCKAIRSCHVRVSVNIVSCTWMKLCCAHDGWRSSVAQQGIMTYISRQ